MALVLADRVQETTNTTGTGTLTLAGASPGYQAFSTIGNANTTYYTITDGTLWEVGIGTYTLSGTTLSRDTVLASSSSGSLISVTAGSKVFCDYPATKSVYQGGAFQGTIDNTVIGATTPNTGTFTTLGSTGTASLGTASTTYIQAIGDASYPGIYATGGTNTPLVLQPKGTGALQAQKTDSTTVGGNARGANATDWQTQRAAAGQVASGQGAVIAGGVNGTASGFGAVIVGGSSHNSTGSYSAIVNGLSNIASGPYTFLGAGISNTAGGYWNIIGGGYSNSGTANAVVTTQAAATNGVTSGSTAVTLAASNAAIKVGQVVIGTGIPTGTGGTGSTYVAAISGTSLTLSQNANATGTPTLSFYTPHGVVVGGGNNQATGSYSFIGGGGDAGTAANRNTANGDWSFVGGGWANKAVGNASSVVGGGVNGSGTTAGNTANATSSYIGGGFSNTVSINGFSSTIGGGSFNNTTASHTTIAGGRYGIDRGITGYTVFPACYQPITNASGVSQSALLIIAKQTTDATATVLTSDGNSAGSTNQVILPNNSAYYVRGSIVAGVTGAGNSSSWTFQGTIKRGANAAATSIVGTGITASLVSQDTGAATWAVSITADTTNGGLAITVTGQASTTIRWVAKCETTEMTY
jgi:hypothetical protein